MTRRSFGTIRRLPSNRWQASYVGPDHRRHTGPVTWTHRTDAEAWLAAERRLIEGAAWTPPTDRRRAETTAGQLLGDYAATVVARRATRSRNPLRPTTRAHYEQTLRLVILPTLGDLPITSITRADIAAWYDSLDPARATRRGHAYDLLRSILAEAVDDGILPENPCRLRGAGKPSPARAGEVLDLSELVAYIAAVDPPYRVLLALTAWCSLRSGEARALRRCDIDDDGRVLRVRQTILRVPHPDGGQQLIIGPPKTAAGVRSAAIPPMVAPGVAEWLAEWDRRRPSADATSLLWTSRDGESPMSDVTLRKAHRRAAAAIGRSSLRVHDLRRTGATLAAQSGATIRELMRRLGHTRPDVAMVYQVADDERDAAVAARMGGLALPPGM
jgi:hypothetical protein